MVTTKTQVEWCSHFDCWQRYEQAGQVYLSPPSGVVSASDFAALDKSGASFARVEIRQTPQHGLYLCFAPSGAWREYMRTHRVSESSDESDVVNTDWIDDRQTPTERILKETMRAMLSRAATR